MSIKVINPGRDGEWPGGVSDGLELSCSRCGQHNQFDYIVTSYAWRKIVVPYGRDYYLGVICLPCLDTLNEHRTVPLNLAEHIEQVQFVGTGYTVVMEPTMIVMHRPGDGVDSGNA